MDTSNQNLTFGYVKIKTLHLDTSNQNLTFWYVKTKPYISVRKNKTLHFGVLKQILHLGVWKQNLTFRFLKRKPYIWVRKNKTLHLGVWLQRLCPWHSSLADEIVSLSLWVWTPGFPQNLHQTMSDTDWHRIAEWLTNYIVK